jgi:hypothetical protein
MNAFMDEYAELWHFDFAAAAEVPEEDDSCIEDLIPDREPIDDFIEKLGEHQDKLYEDYMRRNEYKQYRFMRMPSGEIKLVHIKDNKAVSA